MLAFRSSMVRMLTFVVCFVAAAVHAPAQRFTSDTYSVIPPVDWTTSTQNVPRGAVAFLGAQEQDFTVNITITIDPAPHETLAQYVEATRRQLATPKQVKIVKDGKSVLVSSTPAQMKILTDGKSVLAGGTPAHTIFADLHVSNHAKLPMLQVHEVFAMYKDRAYILTLTYPKGISAVAAQKYIAAFNKVVTSFQWQQGAVLKK